LGAGDQHVAKMLAQDFVRLRTSIWRAGKFLRLIAVFSNYGMSLNDGSLAG